MNEEIIDYIPKEEQKEIFFAFDYDQVEIKNFYITSKFLSNFFIAKGKKILVISYYLLFFPSVFVITFTIDFSWLISKNIGKLIYRITKYILFKIFEFAFDGAKYIFRIFFGKFIGKILIIVGFAIGIMIIYDCIQNDFHEEILEKINEMLNLILE